MKRAFELIAFALFLWLAWHRWNCLPQTEHLPPPANLHTLNEAIRIHTEYQILVDSSFISKGAKRKQIDKKIDSILKRYY